MTNAETGGGELVAERKGDGIEARFDAVFGVTAERGVEAWDIDCGRFKVAELGAEGVVPR